MSSSIESDHSKTVDKDASCLSLKSLWKGRAVTVERFAIGLSTLLIVGGIALLAIHGFSHWDVKLAGIISSSIGGSLFFCGLISHCCMSCIKNDCMGLNANKKSSKVGTVKPKKPNNPEKLGVKEYLESKGVFGVPDGLIQELEVRKQILNGEAVEWDIKLDAGILLYGAAGCGKTTIAKYVGEALGVNDEDIRFLGPGSLKKQYHGNSEEAIDELFTIPEKGFRVIVIDEIDGILGARNGHSYDDKLVSHLLSRIDGLEGKSNFLLFGCTNRPDMLDGAADRRGRMGSRFKILPPDDESREKIFNFHLKKGKIFEEKISANNLTKATEGFSCAQIVGIISDAKKIALLEKRQATEKDLHLAIEKEKANHARQKT